MTNVPDISTRPRSAHELGSDDLVWSHFSYQRLGRFDERVQAAAAAGFAGIGLFLGEYRRLRDEDGRSASDIAATIADHGLVLAELDVVSGWGQTGEAAAAACRESETLAYELADAADVRYLQTIGPYDGDVSSAVDAFGALCDRAADHGLLVGIEFLPFTNIATAADAQRIVEGAARENGGYCADIWHHRRGANDAGMIRALGPDRIFSVQINDGSLTPLPGVGEIDYKTDCMTNRLLPGDGAFDCAGFLGLLASMGVTAPISVEVCSEYLWSMPAAEAAALGAASARAVMAEAATRTSTG